MVVGGRGASHVAERHQNRKAFLAKRKGQLFNFFLHFPPPPVLTLTIVLTSSSYVHASGVWNTASARLRDPLPKRLLWLLRRVSSAVSEQAHGPLARCRPVMLRRRAELAYASLPLTPPPPVLLPVRKRKCSSSSLPIVKKKIQDIGLDSSEKGRRDEQQVHKFFISISSRLINERIPLCKHINSAPKQSPLGPRFALFVIHHISS